jgi:hypothetical protein
MQNSTTDLFDALATIKEQVETLQLNYEARLAALLEENNQLRSKINEIQKIADSLASSSTVDSPVCTKNNELADFPHFSEFYKLLIEYHANFGKALRGMERSQIESLKQAIRRLAKRGYQGTRVQQDHKKFERGSKDIPVPQGATASKSGRTIRYFWSISDHKRLQVFYLGKRGEVYRSER